jgi:hypothetical protein
MKNKAHAAVIAFILEYQHGQRSRPQLTAEDASPRIAATRRRLAETGDEPTAASNADIGDSGVNSG